MKTRRTVVGSLVLLLTLAFSSLAAGEDPSEGLGLTPRKAVAARDDGGEGLNASSQQELVRDEMLAAIFGIRSGLLGLQFASKVDTEKVGAGGGDSQPNCLSWPGDCLDACQDYLTACYYGCEPLPIIYRAICRRDCSNQYNFCEAVCIYPS